MSLKKKNFEMSKNYAYIISNKTKKKRENNYEAVGMLNCGCFRAT